MTQTTMEMNEYPELEAMVEAILFASGEPVSLERLSMATDAPAELCKLCAEALRDKYLYEQRGIRIVCMEDRYQMCSETRFAPAVRKALETRKPPALTQTAIEVLSIIAYAQPTTKSYVEKIRGVDSSYTVNSLAEKGIIEECGKRIVISGCSHKGILDIVKWLKPDVLVGGFHFVKLDPAGADAAFLEDAAVQLMAQDCVYYTGHCTGENAFAFLRERMGKRLYAIPAGAEIII